MGELGGEKKVLQDILLFVLTLKFVNLYPDLLLTRRIFE